MARLEGFRNLPHIFRSDANPIRRRMLRVAAVSPLLVTAQFIMSETSVPIPPDIFPFLEQLKVSHLQGFAHNANNIDEFRDEPKRYDRILRSNAKGVELDFLKTRWGICIGHDQDDLERIIVQSPNLLSQQRAEASLERAIDAEKEIKADIKDSIEPKDITNVANILNIIPSNRKLFIAGKNWPVIEAIKQSMDRQAKVLYSINGQHPNSWDNFEKKIKEKKETFVEDETGVSIKENQCIPTRLATLQRLGLFPDVYDVTNPQTVLNLYSWGAKAISSDRIELLEALAA